ncbi:uncharacterized protein LACBIDRAFT_333637 [Laccaria bicolor S238N-H82]|uniref:Predicted protein n=1 Tax=Laccaria bicolor (strain S238N-H82 / ATCC MYA-4686) TaxID=486041 RepID=B0DWQ8_LACBS|nr:uncharacterized protein LACBIDRAFT_333637 [Laccaria bicolor S238N-H82]EDR00934.1 predicted protein [Laccaria bicolor S238N-H82]|eukprot:XP_001888329.1 predicted protein [Laccaria bicolor S238N-H82]
MQGSPQGKYVIFGNFRDSTSEYSPLSSQLLSTFLQSVSLECGLDSIPTHSTNKLHKTVYKTVNFPWSSQYLNLDRLACACARSDSPKSLKRDHQPVVKWLRLVGALSASFWSAWRARGLVRIPPNSMKMVHKTAFKMVKALWSTLIWSIWHAHVLVWIPPDSLKTVHQTVCEMVEASWRKYNEEDEAFNCGKKSFSWEKVKFQRYRAEKSLEIPGEHNAEHTTVPWTMWPNMAFKLKKVIAGWDSDVVDIAFCRAFAYGKISNKQWCHLSRLILEGVLTIKDWTAEQKQIPETDARFGEIPVVLNLRSLPMVFIKDSSNWVRQNCKIDSATPYTPHAPSAASSPALLSSKKCTYEDLSLVTEENARREHRSVSTPAQNEMEPPAKRQRHVTFSSLPTTMFYMKHRQEQLLQKSTARHSPFNQPSSSSSSQATLASKPPANQVTKSILGGRYKGSAGPSKNSTGFLKD